MRRSKTHRGNAPLGGQWSVLAENDQWYAYGMHPGENGWRQVKLVSKTRSAIKANYALAWNGQRWGKGKDFAALETYAPDLLNWINGVLLIA